MRTGLPLPVPGRGRPVNAAARAPLRFDHLHRLSGRHGVFEHARYTHPRVSHGYTTDDMARLLVVLGRQPHISGASLRLFDRGVDFVLAGRTSGSWHNRMNAAGTWVDRRGSDDAHGRALWGLGAALGQAHPKQRNRIITTLAAGVDVDSPAPRTNAFAILGVCAATHHLGAATPDRVLSALPRLLGRIPGPGNGRWQWPEARLAYANARLPEALLAAGASVGDDRLVDRGLAMLDWLVSVEWNGDHFSFTPVEGRGPGGTGPAFDQQPIEAWAMADACARAAAITGDGTWSGYVTAAAEWFLGRNDAGLALYDPETGAGYDGLHGDRVNANCGAESTLAALGALQTWRRHLSGQAPV